jgi:hypothetical protein
MNDDVRSTIYGTIVLFLLVVAAWLSLIYISACGFTLSCIQAAPRVERTPIPTLIPVAHAEVQPGVSEAEFNKCQVGASDLIAAWARAGYSETEPFLFTDLQGRDCEGTLADIQPLFVENNLWGAQTIGCTSCHNAELTDRGVGLDLSSYDAISLGSRRVPEMTSPGTDIFGRGEWEESLLHEFLVNQGLTPEGHSPDVEPSNPILYVGQVVAGEGEVTVTPTP